MKIVRILVVVLGAYVLLGIGFDAAIGTFQPQGQNTVVVRTFDAQGGSPRDTVVVLREPGDGTLWVESGHWFRGWYRRLLRNPEIQLVRNGEATPYRAVPMDDPESVAMMERVMGKPSVGYYVGRTMLLWAPIRPVRLDPHGDAPKP
jgi:hypothetical protein